MNALKDHIILYDAHCPMCRIASATLVNQGWLEKDGRGTYQENSPEICPLVDMQRAVNEIALVNRKTGEVKYGIESIFAIVSHSIPFFRPLFTWSPFLALMRQVYAFISYNRRVIAPPDQIDTGLQPAFRPGYRLAYLVAGSIICGLIVRAWLGWMFPVMKPAYLNLSLAFYPLILIVPLLFVPRASRLTYWNLSGNLMTCSLLACAGLAALSLAGRIFPVSQQLGLSIYVIDLSVVQLEVKRRVKLLQQPAWISFAWYALHFYPFGLLLMFRHHLS